MQYKRKRSLKNLLSEKEKIIILVYPGLRYTHKKNIFFMQSFFLKNVSLCTKFNLRLNKCKKKCLRPILNLLQKFFVDAIKKCYSYNFHIWKLYG